MRVGRPRHPPPSRPPAEPQDGRRSRVGGVPIPGSWQRQRDGAGAAGGGGHPSDAAAAKGTAAAAAARSTSHTTATSTAGRAFLGYVSGSDAATTSTMEDAALARLGTGGHGEGGRREPTGAPAPTPVRSRPGRGKKRVSNTKGTPYRCCSLL